MVVVMMLQELGPEQKEVEVVVTKQASLPFEPSGIMVFAMGNRLIATSREYGPSTECWLLGGETCKAFVPFKAESLTV